MTDLATLAGVTMSGDMLKRDRERWGLSVSQAAWRFGVSPAIYRELEAGKRLPSFETGSASYSGGRRRSRPLVVAGASPFQRGVG
jgi:hypothetical protein